MEKQMITLIEKAMRHDEDAFQALYDHYYRRAYYIALHMTNNDADAQDAVQESFIQIHDSIGNLKDPEKFGAWLHQVVLSKCKRIFRKNHYMSADPLQMEKYPNQIEKRSYMLPEEETKRKVDKEILLTLIDELPIIQKEVLILAYFEQYKYKEIAAIVGITENTVKSRILAAKKSLKRAIEAYEGRTQSKLTYHAMDAMLSAAFLAGFGVKAGAVSFVFTTTLHQFLNFMKMHTIESALIGVVCISTSAAVVNGYMTYSKTTTDPPLQAIKNVNRYEYTPAKYESRVVQSSEEAYFILVLWANTQEQIVGKTTEECLQVKDIYYSLKNSNSPYYQHLQAIGWTTAYEEKLSFSL